MPALIQILSTPKNALVKQYQKMFQLDGVELIFDEEALNTIADQALERGTGARGLRAIMEEVLLPVMFDLPSRDDIASVVITADVVAKKAAPTMIAHDVVAKRSGINPPNSSLSLVARPSVAMPQQTSLRRPPVSETMPPTRPTSGSTRCAPSPGSPPAGSAKWKKSATSRPSGTS